MIMRPHDFQILAFLEVGIPAVKTAVLHLMEWSITRRQETVAQMTNLASSLFLYCLWAKSAFYVFKDLFYKYMYMYICK